MGGKHDSKPDIPFVATFAIAQVVIIILYLICVDYHPKSATPTHALGGKTEHVGDMSTYPFYTDVAMMIFIGFGFLMTFLRKYAFSALGYTFLITCFVIEVVILVEGFFHEADRHIPDECHIMTGKVLARFINESGHGVCSEKWDHVIEINIQHLIKGLFGSGAVMISFGAVLGRATPKQLLLMAFAEIWIYATNEFLGAYKLKAVDMGGSMFVHQFGAYFGLGVAWALRSQISGHKEDSKKNEKSSYNSDISAMIGTLFLWILWPSFNGALAPSSDAKMRVVINTVFSLCGSCVAAFVVSHLVSDGEFDMVHIQNATLAGGVAVGSSSDLLIGPGGSILVGTVAGVLSVVGYKYIQPYLENSIGLKDTCGVHNLHGMPGIMGAITGAISCAAAESKVYGIDYSEYFGVGRTPSNQWKYQVTALFLTLAMSLVGGILTGMLMNLLPSPKEHYNDEVDWEVPEDDESQPMLAVSQAQSGFDIQTRTEEPNTGLTDSYDAYTKNLTAPVEDEDESLSATRITTGDVHDKEEVSEEDGDME